MDRAPAGAPPQRPVFARRWEVLVIALALAGALVWLAIAFARRPGGVAVVTVGTGTAQTSQSIPLWRQGNHTIHAALPVTLEVRDGAIRFVDSVCPDHTCEGFGWLRHEGDWALCAPAEVMVRIEEA